MADVKISALPASTTPLAGTEVLPIVQGTTTKQVSVANLTAGRVVAMLGGSSVTKATGDAEFTIQNTDTVSSDPDARLILDAGNAGGESEIDFRTAGVTSGVIQYRPADGQIRIDAYNTNDVDIWTGNSSTLLLNDAGDATLYGNLTTSNGNLVIGTSGKGIDFSATSSGSGTMTSELLADYEEGTWTPTGFGITFSSAEGYYTKIGNIVNLTFNLTFPTTSDGNVAYVTGLPYVVGKQSPITVAGYITSIANYFASEGNSYLVPINTTASGYVANASLSTKNIIGSVTYRV